MFANWPALIFAVASISVVAIVASVVCYVVEGWEAVQVAKAARRDREIAFGADIGRRIAPEVGAMVRQLAAREVAAHVALIEAEAQARIRAAETVAPKRGPGGRFVKRAAPVAMSATAH